MLNLDSYRISLLTLLYYGDQIFFTIITTITTSTINTIITITITMKCFNTAIFINDGEGSKWQALSNVRIRNVAIDGNQEKLNQKLVPGVKGG